MASKEGVTAFMGIDRYFSAVIPAYALRTGRFDASLARRVTWRGWLT